MRGVTVEMAADRAAVELGGGHGGGHSVSLRKLSDGALRVLGSVSNARSGRLSRCQECEAQEKKSQTVPRQIPTLTTAPMTATVDSAATARTRSRDRFCSLSAARLRIRTAATAETTTTAKRRYPRPLVAPPGAVIGPVTGRLRGLGQDQNVGDVCHGWSVSWARSVARWSHNGAREMTPR